MKRRPREEKEAADHVLLCCLKSTYYSNTHTHTERHTRPLCQAQCVYAVPALMKTKALPH